MIAKSACSKLFAFSIMALSFSCDNDPQPTPQVCRITKLTLETSGGTILGYAVEYNSSGLPTRVTASKAGTNEEYAVTIDYDNERIVKINNRPTLYLEFTYDGDRIKEILNWSKYPNDQDFVNRFTTTLEYDASGQVEKAVLTGPGLPEYGKLYQRAVWSNGNVDQVFSTSKYQSSGYGPEQLQSEVIRFDDKNNGRASLPFITTFGSSVTDFYISYDPFQNRNNPLEGKYYPLGGNPYEYAVSMEYNEQGYPTKSISSDGSTTESEYECDDVQ